MLVAISSMQSPAALALLESIPFYLQKDITFSQRFMVSAIELTETVILFTISKFSGRHKSCEMDVTGFLL